MEILGIECREAFIQNHQIRILEKRARDVQAATLAMGELPAGFADRLQHPGGHAFEQFAQTQLGADYLRVGIVGKTPNPTAHEQIESKGSGEDVVFMELRSGSDATPPAFGAERMAIEASG